MTDEHRQAIREHRTDLVALLEHEAISNFGDDRRRCTECRHLRTDHRCAEAMQGRMPGVDRHMTPLRHLLQRCPNFKPLEQISGTPDVSP
ncbi:MAG: hypothetical protein U1A81_02145 [Hydrogenophaga sp.]|nr:hypothetical protein [Hydrogenophaga sp.]